MKKILFTSVGSLVGYNVLDVLEGRRLDLNIVGTNSVETDSNIYRCDKAYKVPSTKNNKEAFLNKILEIINEEQPDLIVPCRDDDLSILSTLRKLKPKFADICLAGSKSSVEIMLDKWLTYKFAMSHDLPFANSVISNPGSGDSEVKKLAEEYGFPLLVKPRNGYASHGVFVISNEEQLKEAVKQENVVIQQYLSNPKTLDSLYIKFRNEGIPLFFSLEEEKHSIQTFVHRDGTIDDIFCTLHTMVSGRSLKVGINKNEELRSIGLRYASAMASEGWFGPLNIQCQKQQSSEYIAYELNGRFTGATSARYHLGYDEVGNTLNLLLGWRSEKNSMREFESNKVSRYVTTKPIPNEAMRKFRNEGKWESA